MSIDRVGKGPGASATPDVTAPKDAAAPEETFRTSVGESRAAGTGSVVRASATPLDRLRAGEIDRDTYLNLKVDEAVQHLTCLRAADLQAIREHLRDLLEEDSRFAGLLAQTGAGASRGR